MFHLLQFGEYLYFYFFHFKFCVLEKTDDIYS